MMTFKEFIGEKLISTKFINEAIERRDFIKQCSSVGKQIVLHALKIANAKFDSSLSTNENHWKNEVKAFSSDLYFELMKKESLSKRSRAVREAFIDDLGVFDYDNVKYRIELISDKEGHDFTFNDEIKEVYEGIIELAISYIAHEIDTAKFKEQLDSI